MAYFLNDTIAQLAMMTFSQCASQCREECIVAFKYTALNKYLWMLFVSMFLLTLFYLFNRNENALRQAAAITKQPDISHIQKTIDWLLYTGILFQIAYILVFLISMGFFG